MNAVEFSSKIEKGKIIVPKEYQNYDDTSVRIIMHFDDSKKPVSKKENLLSTFNKMKNEKMFATVSDPVLWVKQFRDEWK